MRRLVAVAAVAVSIVGGLVLTTGTADRPQASPTARQVVGYINHQRSVYGLRRLRLDPVLSRAARRWSLMLARTGDFKHAPLPTGFRWVAETLYRGPAGPVRPWLGSPPHRQIVLSPQAQLVGVGRHGETWTARFARK